MFKCEITGKVTRPGEKMHRIVVERRERTYLDESGNEVGRGWETVRELAVSEEGRRVWWEKHPEEAPKLEIVVPSVRSNPRTTETSDLEGDRHREALRRGLVPIEERGEIVYVTPKEAIERSATQSPTGLWSGRIKVQ